MAVALLARRLEPISELAQSLKSQNSGAVLEAFPTDTSPESLRKTFEDIKQHKSFENLKLKLSIFSIKHSSKKPFMEETYEVCSLGPVRMLNEAHMFQEFNDSLTTYVGGAFQFAQLSLARFFADHGDATLTDGATPKGTLIFTGTLGALRCNAQFASYGAGRAGVRQLSQALAREFSEKGIHVVHTIANGGIEDANGEAQEKGTKMGSDSVGQTYLWLHEQKQDLWVHELDLRPASEKF